MRKHFFGIQIDNSSPCSIKYHGSFASVHIAIYFQQQKNIKYSTVDIMKVNLPSRIRFFCDLSLQGD